MGADEKNPGGEVDQELQDQLQAAQAESAEKQDSQATEDSGDEQLTKLQEEFNAMKDQVLRTQAEMENVRRRAELDVEKAHKFALERFVKELLPVVDSLEKALESAQADESLSAAVREGLEMTLSMFLGNLKKFNVEQLDPEGQPFDPQFHEAMSMVSAPGAEPNSVITVMQKGFTLNGRLVRPAMVMVAKPESAPQIDEQA